MRPFTLNDAARMCRGRLVHGDGHAKVRRICTDSRQAQEGDLFIALRGERFDAHDFLDPALTGRVTGALVNPAQVPPELSPFPAIQVPNVRCAFGDLARAYRLGFDVSMVGITGSNGKTSTKAFMKAALSWMGPVLASPASFNNDIGIPMALLELDASHRAAVMEIGTNHPGEIAHLTRLVQPRYGIITSIGGGHLEHFGSIEAIAHEKGFLAQGLPENGILCVPSDSRWCTALADRTKARVLRVGQSVDADWRVIDLKVSEHQTTFSLCDRDARITQPVHIPSPGVHQALNAAMAFALSVALGGDPERVAEDLSKASMPAMRMQRVRIGSWTFWNDAYNANEDSAMAALDTFRAVAQPNQRRIVVLGAFLELGEHAAGAYERLARKAKQSGFDLLVGVGLETARWVEACRSQGCHATLFFENVSEAAAYFQNHLQPGDQLLLKASRGAHLEHLITSLEAVHSPPSKQGGGPLGHEGADRGPLGSAPHHTLVASGTGLGGGVQ